VSPTCNKFLYNQVRRPSSLDQFPVKFRGERLVSDYLWGDTVIFHYSYDISCQWRQSRANVVTAQPYSIVTLSITICYITKLFPLQYPPCPDALAVPPPQEYLPFCVALPETPTVGAYSGTHCANHKPSCWDIVCRLGNDFTNDLGCDSGWQWPDSTARGPSASWAPEGIWGPPAWGPDASI
ncbi:hypothetical protein K438DRAFT_1943847, partial [Mycena galopus ATCC 62051]